MGLFSKKKKKKGVRKFDIGSKLDNIRTLVASDRKKEAIAYMFMLYSMICGAKFREPKKPSQSIRDYAMIMVQKYNQDPSHVYPFVQAIEAVIYGGKQPSQQSFNKVVEIFSQVFEDVVGKPLPKI